MSIRKQIIAIFLSITGLTLLVVSIFYFNEAKDAHLEEVFNHMESISEAKKNRMVGIVQKRREQVVMLQLREKLREDFANYLKNGDQEAYARLLRALEVTRDRIPSFRDIYLLSTDGTVQVATEVRQKGLDFSNRESFRHAMAGELCMHEFFYDQQKRLNINLSGLMNYATEDLGVIIIKTSADDVLSIINDYTGLGKTGETTLARKLPSGKIYYMTPTRFHSVHGDSLILKDDDNIVMAQALNGREELMTNYRDYRGAEVIASTRYIADTSWGMATKIDWKEAMAPIYEFLSEIIILSLFLFALVAVAGHFFAREIVKPVLLLRNASEEIASGNLSKRINYKGKDELGKLANSFDIMADKLVQTHLSLEEKVKELDSKNDALYRFAYVVSHDLKSPLYSINSLMALLKESLGSCNEPEVQQMLQMAEGKGKHMLNLVNSILHYSVAGVTSEEPENIDLNELIPEVVAQLDVPASISITIEELPMTYIERVFAIQIFQNLIGNAIKYMNKPVGYVKVGYKLEAGEDWFFVSDNGRGIDIRHFEKIFEVFNMTHRDPGVESTGLGLSIVKKIIESKGGRIWVESEVGKGSTFYFILPHQQDVS